MPQQVPSPDYLFKSQLEEFLTNKSEDSIEHLTNIAAISKLDINELRPYLIKGNGRPVVGIAPEETAMCIIDWPTRIVPDPIEISLE